MTKLRTAFMAMTLMSLLVISCKKDEIIQQKNEADSFKINGVASFTSQESFLSSIYTLRDEGIMPLEMRGVTSLNQATTLKSASSEEIEFDEDSLVYSDLLKNFLNENYEIIIGGVFFKITESGTFFTKTENVNSLFQALENKMILENRIPITSALGYVINENLYQINGYDGIYFFNTFEKCTHHEDIDDIPSLSLKSSIYPDDNEWIDVGITGRTGNNLWGFKYERHIHWDKKHRLNIKFYALNYGFYREMGIKTKTQLRGWTGVWHKQNCSEIINGWQVLNLHEKWDDYFFGPAFNPNDNYLPTFSAYPNTWKDLQYNWSQYLGKNWKTFNIMGADIDFSRKDMLGAVWHAAKIGGKTTVDYLNNKFSNPYKVNDAIRIAPQNKYTKETKISLAPFEGKKTNTDKYTLIITASSGFEIGVSYDGQLGYSGIKTFAGKADILKSSVLYGAARRGDSWKAVRITFK